MFFLSNYAAYVYVICISLIVVRITLNARRISVVKKRFLLSHDVFQTIFIYFWIAWGLPVEKRKVVIKQLGSVGIKNIIINTRPFKK